MTGILEVVAGVFIVALLVSPIVVSIMILLKMNHRKGEPVGKVSLEHIAQLEQNDNIIVEDINNALSEIVTRLEAIEEHLEREGQTVKGFANKKGKQQLND
jgi:hypothetical protein